MVWHSFHIQTDIVKFLQSYIETSRRCNQEKVERFYDYALAAILSKCTKLSPLRNQEFVMHKLIMTIKNSVRIFYSNVERSLHKILPDCNNPVILKSLELW